MNLIRVDFTLPLIFAILPPTKTDTVLESVPKFLPRIVALDPARAVLAFTDRIVGPVDPATVIVAVWLSAWPQPFATETQ